MLSLIWIYMLSLIYIYIKISNYLYLNQIKENFAGGQATAPPPPHTKAPLCQTGENIDFISPRLQDNSVSNYNYVKEKREVLNWYTFGIVKLWQRFASRSEEQAFKLMQKLNNWIILQIKIRTSKTKLSYESIRNQNNWIIVQIKSEPVKLNYLTNQFRTRTTGLSYE